VHLLFEVCVHEVRDESVKARRTGAHADFAGVKPTECLDG
jgi:hypothetical protein